MNNFDELMKLQRSMSNRLIREEAVDRKLQFMELVSSLKSDRRGLIQVEAIVLEARMTGISENEVNDLLKDLERDSYLKEVEPGFVKITL